MLELWVRLPIAARLFVLSLILVWVCSLLRMIQYFLNLRNMTSASIGKAPPLDATSSIESLKRYSFLTFFLTMLAQAIALRAPFGGYLADGRLTGFQKISETLRDWLAVIILGFATAVILYFLYGVFLSILQRRQQSAS